MKSLTRIGILFLFAHLLPLAPTALAGADQISARQIEAAEPPIQEFESPMQLEVPLPWLRILPEGAFKSVGTDVSRFVCEDTSFKSLLVKRGRNRKSDGQKAATIELDGTLNVRESYDRLVKLQFRLLQGDETLGVVTKQGIDAEEDKNTPFRTKLTVPLEKLEAAFEAEPPPTLEITVFVKDND